jgi:hypothetical protein
LPDLGQLVEAAIRYWRITASVLAAIGVIVVVCFCWDSLAVRLIAGFHILVAFTTAGALWETNRSRGDSVTGIDEQ